MSQWLERVRARKAIDEDRPEAGKVGMKLEDTPQPSPEPSRWTLLADSGLHHNEVKALDDVLFLFACELIQNPDRGQFLGDLSRTWGHYAPYWHERLPQEASKELERRYRRRLQALGIRDEPQTPQGPKPLRPLEPNPEGTGCVTCGGREYWVTVKGVRHCLACHPARYADTITIGTIQPAGEEASRPSDRRRSRKAPVRPLVTCARPFWQKPDGSCFACGSRRAWRSIHGVVVCAVCHPPASPDLVEEWIEEGPGKGSKPEILEKERKGDE